MFPSRRASLQVVLRSLEFLLGLYSQVLNSVSSVESASNLLVGLHELLELDVKLSVLLLEHSNVLLEGSNLSLDVRVSVQETRVAESDLV